MDRAGERNQSIENALKYWEYVQISGDKYVKPCKKEADLVISGSANLEYFSQIDEIYLLGVDVDTIISVFLVWSTRDFIDSSKKGDSS